MRRRYDEVDLAFMHRSIDLARSGAGFVSPNPMVGAIVVRKGKIIGKGYHPMYGAAHAEVEAIRSAREPVVGSTLYVNLEPCSHFGKTPPCTRLIRDSGIARVVVAMKDPNPLVGGKGIRELRRSGIKVDVGILRDEAELLNESFVKFITTGRPFVTLKIAQTIDGMIADAKGGSRWITATPARVFVHQLRASSDAVLVGAGTVDSDDPALTVRAVNGRNPVRIILDGRLRTSLSSTIYHDKASRTVIFTSKRAASGKSAKVSRLRGLGIEVVELPSGPSEILDLADVLSVLSAGGIASVLIEGGARVASGFLAKDLIDKMICFVAPKILGQGLGACSGLPPVPLSKGINLKSLEARNIGNDIMLTGYLH